MLLLAVFAGAQFLVQTGGPQLLALRLVIGVLLGTDYVVSKALLTEFTPRGVSWPHHEHAVRRRAGGYTCAYFVGYWPSRTPGSTRGGGAGGGARCPASSSCRCGSPCRSRPCGW